MVRERYLIVNADDFGQHPGINRGIAHAHEAGIVTSASLMVRWPAAAEAARYAREHPALSLGLHFDLCEWAFDGETWASLYEVVPERDAEAVAQEAERQLARFRQLAGCDPTHIDSHQHLHRDEPTRTILLDIAHRLSVPLRGCHPRIRYCGDFYGQTSNGQPYPQGISPDWLVEILTTLPEGATELACHPGFEIDIDTMYRSERAEELKALCHPSVRAAVAAHGIELRSFRDLDAWLTATP